MIITIDGPVATGKSSIAKRVAERLGFIYFDTGAMYRCITYVILRDHIDTDNEEQLRSTLQGFNFNIAVRQGEKHYLVDNKDVTNEIRSAAVTSKVSKISAIGAVRDLLLNLQRTLAVGVNAVFEGRDMGTVVFPNAELKIFLYGRPEVRAQRRYKELKEKFPKETANLSFEEAMQEIARRDAYDSSRAIAPLKQAVDAHVIDTSDLTIDEIVSQILELITD